MTNQPDLKPGKDLGFFFNQSIMSQAHNSENCWRTKDGEFIPFSEMTNSHLRAAKNHAQGKELYYFHKTGEWTDIVEKINNEAERRGIVIKDRKSQFHKNERVLKDAIKRLTE